MDAELDRVDARQQRVRQAAQRRPQHPRLVERWWPFLRELYGSDDEIFRGIRIDRRLFDEALSFVSDIPLETRGRRSSIASHREQLLFLLVYMGKGVKSVEILVAKFIKNGIRCTSWQKGLPKGSEQTSSRARSFWKRGTPRRSASRIDRRLHCLPD